MKRDDGSQVALFRVGEDLVEPSDLRAAGGDRIAIAEEIGARIQNDEPIVADVDCIPEAGPRQRPETSKRPAVPPVIQGGGGGRQEQWCAPPSGHARFPRETVVS